MRSYLVLIFFFHGHMSQLFIRLNTNISKNSDSCSHMYIATNMRGREYTVKTNDLYVKSSFEVYSIIVVRPYD